jgi:hypothetical protein
MTCACDGQPCGLASTIEASEHVLSSLIFLANGEVDDIETTDLREIMDTAIAVLHQIAREADDCREHCHVPNRR